jgi:hypothetical protein
MCTNQGIMIGRQNVVFVGRCQLRPRFHKLFIFFSIQPELFYNQEVLTKKRFKILYTAGEDMIIIIYCMYEKICKYSTNKDKGSDEIYSVAII